MLLAQLVLTFYFIACFGEIPKEQKELEIPCFFSDSATGASYDLRPLRMPSASSYRVRDERNVADNYTYVFNVCGDVKPPAGCEKTRDGEGPSPVFQISNPVGKCHRLGTGGDVLGQHKVLALIDKDDPTLGISLTYIHGDRCHSNNVSRSLKIEFYCADQYGEIPDNSIGEPSVCAYTTQFETIFGCPVECPFSNRKLCGDNGFCGMDIDARKPRCFCMKNFYGDDCTETSPPVVTTCNGTCISLIIVILLLTGLLVSALVILLKVRRLSSLNLRFGELSNSFTNDSVSLGTFPNN